MDWNRPIALVIGSEGAGIRRRVLEACDYRIYIPMQGPAESLNASVAAGILLFAAAQR
jgi:23S rRNA (guanosine2251-2'-O)-methyltransferase